MVIKTEAWAFSSRFRVRNDARVESFHRAILSFLTCVSQCEPEHLSGPLEGVVSSPEEITNRRWGPTTGAVVFHLTLLVYVAKLVTSSFTATFLSEFEWLGECRVPLPTSIEDEFDISKLRMFTVYKMLKLEIGER